jgi:hypothetical protein
MATAVDNYLVFDELPDYEKGDKKIPILTEAELKVCMDLQKQKKCHMYIDNDEIYIEKQVGQTTEVNRGVIARLRGKEATKLVQGNDIHIIRKVGEPGSNIASSDKLSTLLKLKTITRTPIFSKLVALTGFENTQGSIYMSGVTTGNPTKDDAAAIRDQSISLDDTHLQSIRDVYNTKENVFLGLGGQTKTHPLRLYAKKVGTSEYKKVSFASGSTGPVSELFLNPIGGGTITERKAKIQQELDKAIVDNKSELVKLRMEKGEYDNTNNKAKSVCARVSKIHEDVLSTNLESELKSLSDKEATLAANKAEGDAYLVREANFGETKKIEDFLKEYILIMSPELWTVPGSGPVAPAVAVSPAKVSPPAAKSVVTLEGTVVPRDKFLGIFGGRRKTKKSNKKSRKGKSKKQNKSRKVFFY